MTPCMPANLCMPASGTHQSWQNQSKSSRVRNCTLSESINNNMCIVHQCGRQWLAGWLISVRWLLNYFPSAGGLSIHWKKLHLASGFPLAPAGRAQTKNRLVLLGPSFLTVLNTAGSWCLVHSGGRMGPLNRDFHSPANSPRAAPVGGRGAWLLVVPQVCLAISSSTWLALLLRPLPTHTALST